MNFNPVRSFATLEEGATCKIEEIPSNCCKILMKVFIFKKFFADFLFNFYKLFDEQCSIAIPLLPVTGLQTGLFESKAYFPLKNWKKSLLWVCV